MQRRLKISKIYQKFRKMRKKKEAGPWISFFQEPAFWRLYARELGGLRVTGLIPYQLPRFWAFRFLCSFFRELFIGNEFLHVYISFLITQPVCTTCQIISQRVEKYQGVYAGMTKVEVLFPFLYSIPAARQIAARLTVSE